MLRRMMMAGGGSSPPVGTVVSLMHFDGTNASTSFVDEMGPVWSKFAGAALTTAVKKFGTASVKFDGPLQSNVTSAAADPGFDLIGGDFTIEMWCRTDTVASAGARLFATGAGTLAWNGTSGIHVLFQIGSSGDLEFQIAQMPNGVAAFTSALAVPVGEFAFLTASWSHAEQKVYLGVNGVVQASPAVAAVGRPTGAPRAAIGKTVALGGSEGDASCLNGWVDEFRLTKGLARYTANFATPDAPFPTP